MSKYPAEFREQAVALVRSGRTIAEVARDLGVSDTTLGYWMKADRAQRGVPEANGQVALTSDERAEMARLRRENATLSEEREILKKAAAFNA
ncbi:IS3 family transposase [Acidothermaceae bacterium B102]|nr:IS3 family transposase [Acidothermaceae bacterium B102]